MPFIFFLVLPASVGDFSRFRNGRRDEMARISLMICVLSFSISMCPEPSLAIDDLRYKTGTNALAKMTRQEVLANIDVLKRYREAHLRAMETEKTKYPTPSDAGPVLGPLHDIALTRKTEGMKVDRDALREGAKGTLRKLLLKHKRRGQPIPPQPTERPLQLIENAKNFEAGKRYVGSQTKDDEERKKRHAEREAQLETERQKGVFYRLHPSASGAAGSQSNEDIQSTAVPGKTGKFDITKLPKVLSSKIADLRKMGGKSLIGGGNHQMTAMAA